jgi:hypothetical protein
MATYSILPGRLDFAFVRGDQFDATLDFSISLAGYTVESDIVAAGTGQVVQQITVPVLNAAAGLVGVQLSEAETAALPAGTYAWSMRLTAPGTVVRTVLAGYIEVKA